MSWKLIQPSNGSYSVYAIDRAKRMTIDAIKEIFPTGECDEMNFILFSTSGVHGSYSTIESVENRTDPEDDGSVTFLIIKPRILVLQYGNVYPETPEDFAFLKKLRASAKEAISGIGE